MSWNKCKTGLAVVFLCVCINSTLYAQELKKEQIKALKIAYITEALQLDSPTAERLWPVYNKYEQRYLALRGKRKELNAHYSQKKEQKSLTEAEATRILDQLNSINKQLQLLEEQRIEELRRSIGAIRTLALKKAEMEFQKDLVKKISKN